MEYLVGRKFHNWNFVAQVTSCHGTTLELTELLRAIHSLTIVCRNSLQAEEKVHTCGRGRETEIPSVYYTYQYYKYNPKIYIKKYKHKIFVQMI